MCLVGLWLRWDKLWIERWMHGVGQILGECSQYFYDDVGIDLGLKK